MRRAEGAALGVVSAMMAFSVACILWLPVDQLIAVRWVFVGAIMCGFIAINVMGYLDWRRRNRPVTA